MYEGLSSGRDHIAPSKIDPVSRRRTRWESGVLLAGLCVALLAWSSALPAIDPDRMTDLGLVSVLPPLFYLSLALICAGFAWQMSYGRATGVLPCLYLVALVGILHATPPLVYGILRYSWAWKHLGIVDYIQRHGAVDPTAPFLAAYHNWPGLFVVTAWIGKHAGARATDIAAVVQYTPFVLTLLLLAVFLLLMRQFTSDRRHLFTAGWLFIVANWIGQDYFSPQGFTFLGYLALLALFLGPLRRVDIPWSARRPAFLNRIIPAAGTAGLRIGRSAAITRVFAAVLALAIILAIVVTHQLTPLVVILAAAALTALGWLAPGYLIFALVAELLWLLWGAAPFVYEQIQNELSAIGALSEATAKLARTAVVSPDRAWVVLIGRILSASIVLVALCGGLRRLLAGFWDLTAFSLFIVPAPLMAVAYGGEAVFRVYLFTSPFLAFFAAAIFFPSPKNGRPAVVLPLLAIACFLSAVGFLFANNGKDREYRFTPDEVATAEWLYSTAPPGSLLIEGARSYPSQFMNYENFSYLPLSEESTDTKDRIAADPDGVLARWMGDPRWSDAYVILTRSQKVYLDASGNMRPGQIEAIEEALLTSPRFLLVRASANAKVFRLLPEITDPFGLRPH
ncbi:hypothetical protein KYK29_08640 [Shinella daejeonensis]|uniref:hypothetical protein n=1 Tax=Shinella daejeonensis TaxID=659017 RepID=UPI0020C76041|nr:hypothetical protein [Shinella daejeonensis]MCP8894996.1 hypothetical protein [Shinella daejeonensis]